MGSLNSRGAKFAVWFVAFTLIFLLVFSYRYLGDLAIGRPGTFTVRLIEVFYTVGVTLIHLYDHYRESRGRAFAFVPLHSRSSHPCQRSSLNNCRGRIRNEYCRRA